MSGTKKTPFDIVSERLHTDGLLVQLARLGVSFGIVTEHDDTGLWWGTIEGGTVADAKAHVDGVLRGAKHDCSALGCAGWLDHSE